MRKIVVFIASLNMYITKFTIPLLLASVITPNTTFAGRAEPESKREKDHSSQSKKSGDNKRSQDNQREQSGSELEKKPSGKKMEKQEWKKAGVEK